MRFGKAENFLARINAETRLGLVGRNCVIRVAQYLTTWVQFRCGDCSPVVGFQVQLRKIGEL
jgi:hypothetical protein